jgi:thiamine-phosphate pyrophosphorylase
MRRRRWAASSSDRVTAARGAAPLVYLVTDRHATAGRPLDAVIAAALQAVPDAGPAGAAVAVQLREKDLDARALLEHARRLRAITANVGVRLFVNDRVDVALAVGADGVHLGGGALAPADVRAIAPNLTIAMSTHTLADVARATADDAVAFVVFGPVFETPSKRAFGPPLGTDALRAACTGSLPVVALGGVTQLNAQQCVAVGAAGVACIRAVLAAPDPRQALGRFFEAIERT